MIGAVEVVEAGAADGAAAGAVIDALAGAIRTEVAVAAAVEAAAEAAILAGRSRVTLATTRVWRRATSDSSSSCSARITPVLISANMKIFPWRRRARTFLATSTPTMTAR